VNPAALPWAVFLAQSALLVEGLRTRGPVEAGRSHGRSRWMRLPATGTARGTGRPRGNVVRIACLAAAVALALAGGDAWAQASPPAAAGVPAQDILVSGVPTDGAQAAQVQSLIQSAYRQALADAGAAALDAAQLQAVAQRVTDRLHEAGWADAHAYLPGQVLAVHLGAGAAPAAEGEPADQGAEQRLPDDESDRHAHGAAHRARGG